MKVPGLFYNAKTFKDVTAGTVIFEEGASGTEMFGVVEGEVEVRLRNGEVRRLGPDDTFGEMAIIDSSPRSGTVVAVTDTKLAVIDRNKFLFLVQETPMFALQVMSSIAGRLRAAETSLRPPPNTEVDDGVVGAGRCRRNSGRTDQSASGPSGMPQPDAQAADPAGAVSATGTVTPVTWTFPGSGGHPTAGVRMSASGEVR
jgi:CRP/FNR family transcriptional regulator, cyclic AMP receptor protein